MKSLRGSRTFCHCRTKGNYARDTGMDLVGFADKVAPLLDELEGSSPERLASLITSAVIASPMPFEV